MVSISGVNLKHLRNEVEYFIDLYSKIPDKKILPFTGLMSRTTGGIFKKTQFSLIGVLETHDELIRLSHIVGGFEKLAAIVDGYDPSYSKLNDPKSRLLRCLSDIINVINEMETREREETERLKLQLKKKNEARKFPIATQKPSRIRKKK